MRTSAGAPAINDEQVISGVEDLQFLIGVDQDGDRSVDFYVDPETALGAGDTVVALRLWLLVRAELPDFSFSDDRSYAYADRAAFVPADNFRRLLVSKTIQLRNTR